VYVDGIMASMVDELLDAFDDDMQPLGPRSRDEVHRDGLWHAVFHCVAVRTRPPARLLLQRRPSNARSFPGLLDLTSTGHLLSGERPADGVRELREEVGLVVTPDQLVSLGQRRMVDDAGEGGRNREIVHAFLLPCDDPLESFALAGGDVDGLVEITVDGLRAVARGGRADAVEVDLEGVLRPIVVGTADLVPAIDDSWNVMATVAERFVDGQE
jgi:8-oxo-dGTP pyrophosphatase MutT (NUDIX family)